MALALADAEVELLRRKDGLSGRVVSGCPVVEVAIEHVGGGIARGGAMLVDVTSGAVSLIWTGFVHVGACFTLTMQEFMGSMVVLDATVTGCHFIKGRFHLLTLKLHAPVDPADFADPKSNAGKRKSADTTSSLVGRCLYVHESDIHRDLLAMLFAETRLSLEYASSTGEALDSMRKGGVDLIVCEHAMDGRDVKFITAVRQEGIGSPLLVLGPSGGVNHQDELIEAGASAVLPRPLEPRTVVAIARKLMSDASDPLSGTAPIRSSLPNQAEMGEWLEKYVDRVRSLGDEIRRDAERGDAARAGQLCHNIMDTAESYGYEPLAFAARETSTALVASMSCEESMPQIRQLLRVIDRLAA